MQLLPALLFIHNAFCNPKFYTFLGLIKQWVQNDQKFNHGNSYLPICQFKSMDNHILSHKTEKDCTRSLEMHRKEQLNKIIVINEIDTRTGIAITLNCPQLYLSIKHYLQRLVLKLWGRDNFAMCFASLVGKKLFGLVQKGIKREVIPSGC